MQIKQLQLAKKKDKDGNTILVDEDGNIYTKNEKTEVIKITNKDGDEVFVDNENNTYIREEKTEKHSKLELIMLVGIALMLAFIFMVVFY